ncbi:DUF2306 domain-containing protein [Maritimibacter sp. UBA3975]|uniref:DUF2306 domain-containing protein n=1 Tax=Maritimibacter sp. UBA3975 TaxID=1946833 RepID=UPI0025BE0040|nr:DUF2306 domain-containing protein [Maritimibacter sp. UBA3975]|tara:strand:+ start:4124 stop:4639 length:516 start_codon:yes stop_codon:yes gene_type:complete
MFDLTPLFEADLAVQIHVIAATESILLTPFALFRRKRDLLHRITGYAWVTNMLVTAVSSFWIMENQLIGPFSPIHALSLLVLFNLFNAIRQIRRGNVKAHQGIMKGTALWGLGIAGGLTLVPGRIMNEVVFGSGEPGSANTLGAPLTIAMVVAALAYIAWAVRRDRQSSRA